MFKKILILLSLTVVCHIDALENSILPEVEKFECVENLPIKKYSTPQAQEILCALSCKADKVRCMSYNMLFNIKDASLAEENRWEARLPRIVELLKEAQPDILGVQELYQKQVKDIIALVGDTYAFFQPPNSDREQNGIFYKKRRFNLVEGRAWSMTMTPAIPSSEALTMVMLDDLKTKRRFAVFNTHLSFSKVDKRDFQARFIRDHVEPFAYRMPVIFMGDLNTFPNRPDLSDLPSYDGDYVHRILTCGSMKDAREKSLLGHLGPISTFTNAPGAGTPFKGVGTPGIFLDHFYVSNRVEVLIHAVQPGQVKGHFPSDHMPILIDCLID